MPLDHRNLIRGCLDLECLDTSQELLLSRSADAFRLLNHRSQDPPVNHMKPHTLIRTNPLVTQTVRQENSSSPSFSNLIDQESRTARIPPAVELGPPCATFRSCRNASIDLSFTFSRTAICLWCFATVIIIDWACPTFYARNPSTEPRQNGSNSSWYALFHFEYFLNCYIGVYIGLLLCKQASG